MEASMTEIGGTMSHYKIPEKLGEDFKENQESRIFSSPTLRF
jgi:hypothetical protein